MRRVSLLLSLAALALGLAALPPALISRPEAGEDFVHF